MPIVSHIKDSPRHKLRFALVMWMAASLGVVFTFAATVSFPLFFLIACLLTLLPGFIIIFLGNPINGLLLSALFIVSFNAFYHPMFGFFSGLLGYPTGLFRLALGIRSAWYCLALLAVAVQISRLSPEVRKSVGYPVLIFLCFLVVNFGLSGGGVDSRISYLMNSFLPLSLTVVGFGAVLSNIKIHQDDAKLLYRLLIAISGVGFVYFFLLPVTYDFFRPDLASFMRARPGEYIPKGGFDPSWGTRIADYYFNRFVGSFPDPIIAGYFFACMTFIAYMARWRAAFIWFGMLLAISLSKGAWMFFVQAVIIYHLHRKGQRYALMGALLLAGFQLSLAAFIDSSNKMHFLGLIGGVTSVFQGGVKAMILGYGVGDGGNMGRTIEAGGLGASWLGSGSESGIGVIAHQLGLLGALLLVICFWRLFSLSAKGSAVSQDDRERHSGVKALVLSLMINSFLQENCINASLLSTVLLGVLLISALPRVASWTRRPSTSQVAAALLPKSYRVRAS
ncbi:MAG: hypothetical protein EOP38_03825 [Rubrivivax sp.]|nr:MAG: hypothetical protein EOP38_03825 [Rubrivivax sp.]